MAETTNNTSTNTGLFNFQDILTKFYKWTPEKDDTAGQALKNTFLADNVQTVMNNMMSKDLAYTNAEIATGQMTDAAKLELANTSLIMEDEFNYGMQKMGAEYDYQSRFAVDEANRDLNATAQKGDIQQGQTKLEGEENRLNIEAAGKEELDQISATGDQAVRQIGSQGEVDKGKIKAQGEVDKGNITTQGQVDEDKIKTQGEVDYSKIKAQGEVDYSNITAQGEVDKGNITAQGYMNQELEKVKGNETRKNMTQQTDEDSRTAKRQSKYARGLAGFR